MVRGINFYGLNENCTVLVINSKVQIINSMVQGINFYGLNEKCTVLVINSRVQIINSTVQGINFCGLNENCTVSDKFQGSDDKLDGSEYERYLDYLNRTDSQTFSTKILPTELTA